jgi:hypothetical protein
MLQGAVVLAGFSTITGQVQPCRNNIGLCAIWRHKFTTYWKFMTSIAHQPQEEVHIKHQLETYS